MNKLGLLFATCFKPIDFFVKNNMNQLGLRVWVSILLCMVGTRALADIIKVKNSDGITISYRYIKDGELEVCHSVYGGSVVIPEEVTYMGTTMKVSSIGDQAFYFCLSLKSVTIPNSVTSIGKEAFYMCTGLNSVTIGKNVRKIENLAFYGCSNMISIKVEAGNTKYDSRDECNGIIETEFNMLILGCRNTIIPNSVTSIGASAFNGNRNLESITIPTSVTSIGKGAFNGCFSLSSVTIPNSVTDIGNNAFSGCENLVTVSIGNSVTDIGKYAFSGCENLVTVSIGNSVASIGERAFYDCGKLKNVKCYAKEVPSTAADAFREALDPYVILYVPAASIDAYKAVAPWKDFTYIKAIDDSGSDGGDDGVHEYDFAAKNAEGVTIYYNYINGGEELEVTKGDKVVIDGYFIPSYSGNVVIPEEVTYKDKTMKVTSIGDRAFNGCYKLTSVTIPNSVISIGWCSFGGCESLTSIAIPSGVKSIGIQAFACCSSLTSITIPEGVTNIDNFAFSYCKSLTSVTIPHGVKSIGESAFYGCIGLTSITIPNSVTSIRFTAFGDCSLNHVYCLAENVPRTNIESFGSTQIDKATLHVPAASVDAYKAAAPWSGFKDIVALTDQEMSIDGLINDSKTEVARYTIGGQRVNKQTKGLNIIRMSDGTTKKVVVK